jgi:hypothetical protein
MRGRFELTGEARRIASSADQVNHLAPKLRRIGRTGMRHREHLLRKPDGLHEGGSTSTSHLHRCWCVRDTRCWPYFSKRSIASRLGPAQPRAVTWNGAGAWLIFSQSRQVTFPGHAGSPSSCAGSPPRVSVTSSPSLRSRAPPQHMQVAGAGSTTRSRGRCSGKGWPRALAGESRDIGGGAT